MNLILQVAAVTYTQQDNKAQEQQREEAKVDVRQQSRQQQPVYAGFKQQLLA
jgi:hypothetical protein